MNNKICDKCGHEIGKKQKYCPECGHQLAGSVTTQKRSFLPKKESLIIVAFVIILAIGFILIKPEPDSLQSEGHPALTGSMDQVSMAMLDNLPDDFNTLVQMGNEYMDNGNFPVASEIYSRALAIDSLSPDVRTDYGACLHGMGLPDRAIEEFKRTLEFSPNHAITNFNLGIVFNHLEQADSARHYFTVYLDLEPEGRAAPTARQLLAGLGT